MAGDPQVDAIVGEIERLVERVISKITLDVVANLVETTPVDTGWARANWIPAVGSPFEDTTGSPENPSAAEQQQGLAAAARYRLAQGSVFVTNNVPYILRLNDGSSIQAPAGFVQRAVEKAVEVDLPGL